MNLMRVFCAAAAALCVLTTSVYAQTEEFDADKMLAELESQLKLSGDKLSKLKPTIDAKSAELKQEINASVEQGFVELEKLSGQLDAASEQAQAKLQEALSSEEMQQVRDYLKKWDHEAVERIRADLAAQLAAFLKLTEDQMTSLKPVLEDSFSQLSQMLEQLASEGGKTMEEFKQQYEQLGKELEQKLKDGLNSEQIESLDIHRDELEEKIKTTLYSV